MNSSTRLENATSRNSQAKMELAKSEYWREVCIPYTAWYSKVSDEQSSSHDGNATSNYGQGRNS